MKIARSSAAHLGASSASGRARSSAAEHAPEFAFCFTEVALAREPGTDPMSDRQRAADSAAGRDRQPRSRCLPPRPRHKTSPQRAPAASDRCGALAAPAATLTDCRPGAARLAVCFTPQVGLILIALLYVFFASSRDGAGDDTSSPCFQFPASPPMLRGAHRVRTADLVEVASGVIGYSAWELDLLRGDHTTELTVALLGGAPRRDPSAGSMLDLGDLRSWSAIIG